MPAPTTIADIAREAGVGTATVDRVLNRRPGVNAETLQRVMQAVEKLGVPPQPGRPRRSANFEFAYVMPAESTSFFELVERQIAQSAGDFRHQHINEVTHRFDAGDPAQFAADLAKLGESDGIALLAPDVPVVKLAINELVRSGVHVVTLFSDVTGSMRETHVGADNRSAGRTAGLLLARMAGHGDTLLLTSQATRLSCEIDRRIGFSQVLEERFPHLRTQRLQELPADDEAAAAALLRAFDDDIDPARLAGLYNVGSGSVGVARAMASLRLARTPAVAAHDLCEAHRALLTTGELAYVLHQDIHYCILTAARVLRALCENLRGALTVVQPRVEILTAENLH
jgi:LacI family transcriptional regulator